MEGAEGRCKPVCKPGERVVGKPSVNTNVNNNVDYDNVDRDLEGWVGWNCSN